MSGCSASRYSRVCAAATCVSSAVAHAHGAYAERVENGTDLPAALARAFTAMRDEKRQALLEVRVSY